MVRAATAVLDSSRTAVGVLDVRKVMSAQDMREISGTLSRAFFDDPVLTWAFPDPDRRWQNLPRVFELYAQVFMRHDETYMTAGGTAAALWLPPGAQLFDDGAEAVFGREVEKRAEDDAGRLFELMAMLDEHHPRGTYWTLQLLAVEPQWQGRGIGSALMGLVLARCDLERVPAYLEATSEPGVAMYERHGFEMIGEIQLPDGPPLYPMWRSPA